MNLLAKSFRRRSQRESGMAVIVVLALLSLILLYLAANLRVLNSLDAEVKLVEKRQTRRLALLSQATNAPPTTNAPVLRRD